MTNKLAHLIMVEHGQGDFSSRLISLVSLGPGELLACIEGATPAAKRAYTSVQKDGHSDIELNSDLVYCNHSCDPSVVFDMEKMEVRTVSTRSLKKGDDVTFFYPSTEWDMDQPFACHCGAANCLQSIHGARYLPEEVLKRYWLNEHVKRLLQKRAQVGKS